MAEVKVTDVGDLFRMVENLKSNGYAVSTYIVWKNRATREIDHFSVEVNFDEQ